VRIRQREGHTDVLRRLRRSPRVARSIPAPLRVFDLAVVVLSLPLTLLLGTVIALAVFLDSPGPVFYRSRRIGRGGQAFDMLKFRTMVRDAPGPSLSARGDERYTPLGRTLAYSRLDELPQLWNVLRGQMRLVGPRPEVEDFVREFPEEYERILSVPPGLTGPAQVAYAWEGEILARAQAIDRERVYRDEILPYKLAIDLGYARRHSVRSDLALLGRTLLLPAVRLVRRLRALVAGPDGRLKAARVAGAAALAGSIVALVVLVAAEAASPL
jgi:lipopolysaccharide/colanic/teichoic acid biosynthesis glycosyltransferase